MTDDRQAFLAQRAEGLGSSDSPAILGLSPWAGPLSVYLSKTGEVPDEQSLPMWLGLVLQRSVGDLFAARTGKRIRAANIQYKHPVWDFIRCHLDFTVIGEQADLECKTARSTDGWGEEGSGDIPPVYWVQVQHQMAVRGRAYTYVAVLFGHYDFRWYLVERDEDFIRRLCAALVEFWEKHIVPRVPPPLDGSDEATKLLNRRYPRDTEPALPATPEQAALVAQLVVARNAVMDAKALDKKLTQQVKDMIGTHAGLSGPGFDIIWRKGKPSSKIKWREVAREIEPFVPEGEYQAAIDHNTEEKEGTRPFRLKADGLKAEQEEESSDGEQQ